MNLVLGSMILMDSPVPELQLNLRIVLPIVLAFTGLALFLLWLAVSAQRRPAATGLGAMVGKGAETLTAIEPGRYGLVAVHGESWRATADERIPEGARVRVARVDGLTLTVRKD